LASRSRMKKRTRSRAGKAAPALQHRPAARLHEAWGTSRPTTSTTAAARRSAPPAAQASTQPAPPGLRPAARYERITREPPPVAGFHPRTGAFSQTHPGHDRALHAVGAAGLVPPGWSGCIGQQSSRTQRSPRRPATRLRPHMAHKKRIKSPRRPARTAAANHLAYQPTRCLTRLSPPSSQLRPYRRFARLAPGVRASTFRNGVDRLASWTAGLCAANGNRGVARDARACLQAPGYHLRRELFDVMAGAQLGDRCVKRACRAGDQLSKLLLVVLVAGGGNQEDHASWAGARVGECVRAAARG